MTTAVDEKNIPLDDEAQVTPPQTTPQDPEGAVPDATPIPESELAPATQTEPQDRLDLELLTTFLAGKWADSRKRVIDHLLENPLPEDMYDLSTAEHRTVITDAVRKLAHTSIPGLGFTLDGKPPVDPVGAVTSVETMAMRDLSLMIKAGVQWGLFGGAVHALGTERHHREYLKDIVEGRLFGCFGMTERGHGSDVQSITTTATYDRDTDEFVIDSPDESSHKEYIGNAARDGRMCVVFAQLITEGQKHGVHALMVPLRDGEGNLLDGVEVFDCGRKMGLNGVDNGRIAFHGVRVPRTNLLNRYGDVDGNGSYTSPIDNPNRRFFTMIGTLVRGRISVGGGALMATKKALAIAVRYAERRRQFARVGGNDEVSLLEYLQHQRRLLLPLARTYAYHFAQEDLYGLYQDVLDHPGEEKLQRNLENRAAGMKSRLSWHATSTIQTCREATGGAGYLAENQLVELKGDSDIYTTFEGDNTVLMQLVGKGLMTNFKQHLGELDQLGLVKFAAGQITGVVLERTNARNFINRLLDIPLSFNDKAVLASAWHVQMLATRERDLIESLARRLNRTKNSKDQFWAVNRTQPHLLKAAEAHVERVALEAFVQAVENCQDPGTKAVLSKVCTLHALAEIERDAAWFLQNDRMTPAQSKTVTAAIDELLQEVRLHARDLVDAFGFPEEWLTAPMIRR